jgi:hypothetical protein
LFLRSGIEDETDAKVVVMNTALAPGNWAGVAPHNARMGPVHYGQPIVRSARSNHNGLPLCRWELDMVHPSATLPAGARAALHAIFGGLGAAWPANHGTEAIIEAVLGPQADKGLSYQVLNMFQRSISAVSACTAGGTVPLPNVFGVGGGFVGAARTAVPIAQLINHFNAALTNADLEQFHIAAVPYVHTLFYLTVDCELRVALTARAAAGTNTMVWPLRHMAGI